MVNKAEIGILIKFPVIEYSISLCRFNKDLKQRSLTEKIEETYSV